MIRWTNQHITSVSDVREQEYFTFVVNYLLQQILFLHGCVVRLQWELNIEKQKNESLV